MFIWWNLLFLPLDIVYTLIFIPACSPPRCSTSSGSRVRWRPRVRCRSRLVDTGHVPHQARTVRGEGLEASAKPGGFLFYTLGYMFLLQPVSVWGYAAETIGLAKKWGTK